MLKFIFNNRRNERLSSNSRQSLGRGSNKSYAINSHASWQNNFNKNTLGTSSCQNCELINCLATLYCSPNRDNPCAYKCTCDEYPSNTQTTIYCNGEPPANALII
jgi:hypothetical protein